jgi:hypothetical protein
LAISLLGVANVGIKIAAYAHQPYLKAAADSFDAVRILGASAWSSSVALSWL